MSHAREGSSRPDLAAAHATIGDSPQFRRAELDRLHRQLLRDVYALGRSSNETQRLRCRSKVKREVAEFTAALDAYAKIVRHQARMDLRGGLRTRLHDVILKHLTVRKDDPFFGISEAIRHALRIVESDVG